VLRDSTSAWRILTVTSNGPATLSPLRWLDDLDGDGKPEAIVWTSFPLREDGEYYESGLMAWVYRVDPGGLAIDWGLSRRMARQIAAAYRTPPRGDPASVQSTLRAWGALRQAALDGLDAFAGSRCTTRAEAAPPSR
jgi:hypothetical protein